MMPHLTRSCPVAECVQIGGNPLGTEALMHILIKNDPHNSGLGLVDNQLVNLMLALVEASASYKVIAIGRKTSFKTAVLDKLAEGGFCTNGSLFAFSVRLPESDVVCELVCVAVKSLLTLLGAPYPDAVLYKPFHNKRRFVSNAPDAVKHKNKQNIKLALLGAFLDNLELVPVFSPYLVAGNTVLLFFMHNRPAHFLAKAMTFLALHGNVGLAVVVVVHLLVGGHSI